MFRKIPLINPAQKLRMTNGFEALNPSVVKEVMFILVDVYENAIFKTILLISASSHNTITQPVTINLSKKSTSQHNKKFISFFIVFLVVSSNVIKL